MKLRIANLIALTGISGLLLGVMALTPAQADDLKQDRKDIRHDVRDIHQDRKDIRQDNRDIRNDRGQIGRLDNRLVNEVDHHNYCAARRTAAHINQDRRDVNQDRRDRNQDARDLHQDHRDLNHDRRDLRQDH